MAYEMQKQEKTISKEPIDTAIVITRNQERLTKTTNETISTSETETTDRTTNTIRAASSSTITTTTQTPAVLIAPSSPGGVIHRHNNGNRLENRIRPQSVVSARALCFDEKMSLEEHSGAIPKTKSIKTSRTEQISTSDPKFLSPCDSVRLPFSESLKQSGYVNFPSPLSSTSISNRREIFTPGSNSNSSSGSLFKSASATSVAKDLSDSLPPMAHQRKISYQPPRTFRPNGGSTSKSINEISNLVRVRNSALGKSAPTLSTVSFKIYFLYP